MSMQNQIQQKLQVSLPLQHLEVVNESHLHSVPPGSESHFKLVLVSAAFDGKRQVARHQQIYALLAAEMKAGIHALALHTYTPQEWQDAQAQAPASPQCMGGSKGQSGSSGQGGSNEMSGSNGMSGSRHHG